MLLIGELISSAAPQPSGAGSTRAEVFLTPTGCLLSTCTDVLQLYCCPSESLRQLIEHTQVMQAQTPFPGTRGSSSRDRGHCSSPHQSKAASRSFADNRFPKRGGKLELLRSIAGISPQLTTTVCFRNTAQHFKTHQEILTRGP